MLEVAKRNRKNATLGLAVTSKVEAKMLHCLRVDCAGGLTMAVSIGNDAAAVSSGAVYCSISCTEFLAMAQCAAVLVGGLVAQLHRLVRRDDLD